LILRRPDQLIAATILAAALAVLGLYWTYQALFGRGLIDIDRAEPQEIQFLVDLNEADWPELALLPNVGEQLAKRIVEFRRQQPSERFRDLDQLQDVRGIGPKTFDSVRPYLVPIPDVEATAGDSETGAPGKSKS
jgi:competence protein ComEA